jgi:AAA+ superfamily predicted ATPase
VSDALLAREWLDAELERIWLTAEAELRRMQHFQLRPAPTNPAVADVESVLADRRAARTGKASSPIEPEELHAAAEKLTRKLARLRGPAIARLTERLGLSTSDIDGLLLVAAPSIDPPLADLFAAVRGTAGARRGVDAALIGQLLSFRRDQRVELLALLDEERPPVARRLIQVAPAQEVYASATYRSIQPTLDLLWLLTTDGETPSPSLSRSARVVRGATSWDGLLFDEATRAWLDPLAQRFRAGTQAARLPWVALWGAAGSGKREVASRLAALAGKPLLIVDPKGTDKTQLADLVRRACRDAAWLGAALYLGPLGGEELHEQGAVITELERASEPVLLGFEATTAPRLKTAHPLGEFPLPIPLAPTRVAIWQRELASATVAPDTDVESIARGYKLTPGEIIESAREAIMLSGANAIDGEVLRSVMERRLRNELGAVATRLVVETSWEDVILPIEAVERVRELIARKRYEDRVYRQWGLDRRIGYGKGIIALFSGPPGTGKSLLAGLIAKELGFELYQVDLSQIFSRWIGETEKALSKVFDQAERAHAVLLFDEADALFAKRTEVEDSRDRYANVAVNFLLQRLERYSGVAILTTNKDSYLDEALRRRLSLHLQLDEPEVPERLRLWEKHLPQLVPGSDTVDLASIASEYELSGGYIKNVAVRATFLSAAEDVPLSTEQVRRAAILEMEDMGRVVFWPQPPDGTEKMTSQVQLVDYVEG